MTKKLFKISAVLIVMSMVMTFAACKTTIDMKITLLDKDGNAFTCEVPAADAGSNDADNGNSQQQASPAAPAAAPSEPQSQAAPADTPAEPQSQAAPADTPADTPAEPQSQAAPADTPSPAGLSSSSSKEEIVAKYIQVYNTTKATGTFLGRTSMSCDELLVEGKSMGVVKNAVDGVMGKGTNSDVILPPSIDAAQTCMTTADDITEASYTDNGDGTATIKLTVKDSVGSRRGQDPAGRMFDVMEDLVGTLADFSVLSWAQGDANSNVVLTSGGYCEVTFNTSTNMMTKATYTLITKADITHANILIVKDKCGNATFSYVEYFPQ